MNRQHAIMIAVPLLAVVLIVVWLPSIRGISGADGGKARLVDLNEKKLEGIHDLIKDSSRRRHARMSEFEEWGRDPFAEKVVALPPPKAEDPWPLKGIFWDEERPSALIGETIVVVGDRLNNFTVTNIQPDHVIISDGHAVIRLEISQ